MQSAVMKKVQYLFQFCRGSKDKFKLFAARTVQRGWCVRESSRKLGQGRTLRHLCTINLKKFNGMNVKVTVMTFGLLKVWLIVSGLQGVFCLNELNVLYPEGPTHSVQELVAVKALRGEGCKNFDISENDSTYMIQEKLLQKKNRSRNQCSFSFSFGLLWLSSVRISQWIKLRMGQRFRWKHFITNLANKYEIKQMTLR